LSFYPITSAKQNIGKYYKRIYDKLTERKNFVDYATIHMIRNESAMSRWWNIIKNGVQQIPSMQNEGGEKEGERATNVGCHKSLSLNAYVSMLTVVFKL
jgi:hypothetical protein